MSEVDLGAEQRALDVLLLHVLPEISAKAKSSGRAHQIFGSDLANWMGEKL